VNTPGATTNGDELARAAPPPSAPIDTLPLPQLKQALSEEPPTDLLSKLPIIRPKKPGGAAAGVRVGVYRLLREIGRGPRGIVFEAEDTLLHRPVAVKVLAAEMTSRGPTWGQRYLQEARLAARVNNPLTLSVFAFGQDAELVYCAMPLMTGGSAADALRTRGPFNAREATRITHQVALALAAAHARGLAHGNVKPSNIFIGDGGQIKVADFTAPHLRLDPAAGGEMRPQDVANDLRLLGATYHWLLTGWQPVDGDDLAGAAIPPACARVIAAAMSRPSGYASAAEVAMALGELLALGDDELSGRKPMNTSGDSQHEARAPQVGDVLGKCLLIERVGHGSAGVVFRARHQSLNIPVAVKVLHVTDDIGVHRQLRSEAQLLARLNHPHVVRVWDFEDDPCQPFLVMEFVEGPGLSDVLREQGRIPPERALQLVRQIADGLAAAQRLGIVHRDVKPGNILLTKDGAAKLADLGLAVLVEHERGKAAGGLAGTAAYMPPEQASGAIDHRSDIYSLGATYYYMVTGQVPFQGTTRAEVIRKHATETPISPRELVPHLPEAVSAVILKMMAKDPAERYQTYDELLAVLSGLDSAVGAVPAARST
jgi:serine/threonine protein kinase